MSRHFTRFLAAFAEEDIDIPYPLPDIWWSTRLLGPDTWYHGAPWDPHHLHFTNRPRDILKMMKMGVGAVHVDEPTLPGFRETPLYPWLHLPPAEFTIRAAAYGARQGEFFHLNPDFPHLVLLRMLSDAFYRPLFEVNWQLLNTRYNASGWREFRIGTHFKWNEFRHHQAYRILLEIFTLSSAPYFQISFHLETNTAGGRSRAKYELGSDRWWLETEVSSPILERSALFEWILNWRPTLETYNLEDVWVEGFTVREWPSPYTDDAASFFSDLSDTFVGPLPGAPRLALPPEPYFGTPVAPAPFFQIPESRRRRLREIESGVEPTFEDLQPITRPWKYPLRLPPGRWEPKARPPFRVPDFGFEPPPPPTIRDFLGEGPWPREFHAPPPSLPPTIVPTRTPSLPRRPTRAPSLPRQPTRSPSPDRGTMDIEIDPMPMEEETQADIARRDLGERVRRGIEDYGIVDIGSSDDIIIPSEAEIDRIDRAFGRVPSTPAQDAEDTAYYRNLRRQPPPVIIPPTPPLRRLARRARRLLPAMARAAGAAVPPPRAPGRPGRVRYTRARPRRRSRRIARREPQFPRLTRTRQRRRPRYKGLFIPSMLRRLQGGKVERIQAYFRFLQCHELEWYRHRFSLIGAFLQRKQFNVWCPDSRTNCLALSFLFAKRCLKKPLPITHHAHWLNTLKVQASTLMIQYYDEHVQEPSTELRRKRYHALDHTEDLPIFYQFLVDRSRVCLNLFDVEGTLVNEFVPQTRMASPHTRRKIWPKINIWLVANHALALFKSPHPSWIFHTFDWSPRPNPEQIALGLCKQITLDFPADLKKSFFKIQPRKYLRQEKVFAVFDFETLYQPEVKPYAVGFWDGVGKPTMFVSLDCAALLFHHLANYMMEKQLSYLYLFAHNAGKFDTHFLLQCLPRHWYLDQRLIVQNGRMSRVGLNFMGGHSETGGQRSRHTIIICDSFAILPQGLRTLARDLEIRTQKGDLPYHLIQTIDDVREREPAVRKYLAKDCRVLYRVLAKFQNLCLDKFDFDPIGSISLSSISKNLFFEKFYNPIQHPMYNIGDALDLIWRRYGYFGGRNEAFQLGLIEKPLYYYDFTSLYPSVLCQDMPYGQPEIAEIRNNCLPPDFFGFVLCNVQSKGPMFPLLGCRSDDYLIFPLFKNSTMLLIFSAELEKIRDWDLPYEFEFLVAFRFKRAPFYRPFIKFLYQLKEEGNGDPLTGRPRNEALRTLGKLLVNCAYGFWALKYQHIDRYVIRKNPETAIQVYLQTGVLKKWVTYHNRVLIKFRGQLTTKEVNIPFASACTCYARLKLYELMRDIRLKGGQVYYCDTDSVITDFCLEEDRILCRKYQFEGDTYTHGEHLGGLKNEVIGLTEGKFNCWDAALILGLKMYMFKSPEEKYNVMKFRGLNLKRKMKKTLLKEEKIILLAEDPSLEKSDRLLFEDALLLNEGWTLRNECIRIFGSAGKCFDDHNMVTMDARKINFTKIYKKGSVQKDGSVLPLNI